MKSNIRKYVDQGIRGWIFGAAHNASYPLTNVEINTCLGCCSCFIHDMVLITVHQKTPGAKTRGFAVRMTADLAGRAAPAYICEQIVKRLKEGEVWLVDEAQPLKSVDIFEESNARIVEIERAAAAVDEAREIPKPSSLSQRDDPEGLA